jgi:hypothetical protein
MILKKRMGQTLITFIAACVLISILTLMSGLFMAAPSKKPLVVVKSIPPVKKQKRIIVRHAWHPSHVVKSWTTTYKGHRLHVIQLPRCQHLETMLTYNPSGETFAQAKRRVGGAAIMSGSFHHSQSFSLADFLQRDGRVLSPARTGRIFLVILPDGSVDLTKNYGKYKRKPGVSAMAMGQVLVPWQPDGFGTGFANRHTDRMALALNRNYIYIIQGQADLWALASYIKHKLPVRIAANSDGGHVVRGSAPVHVVFRWKPKGIVRELLK